MGGVSHPILFQALWPRLRPTSPSALTGSANVMETDRGIVVLSPRRSMLSVNGNVQSPRRAARACKSNTPLTCSNTRNRRLCRISALDFQHPSQSSQVVGHLCPCRGFRQDVWSGTTSSPMNVFGDRGRKGNYLQHHFQSDIAGYSTCIGTKSFYMVEAYGRTVI